MTPHSLSRLIAGSVMLTALLPVVSAATTSTASPSPTAARVGAGRLVARASVDYSLGEPAALTTADKVTVVAWVETGPAPDKLKVRTQRGAGKFVARSISVGDLDNLDPVSLIEDRRNSRILMTSQAYDSSDTSGTIGTYLWVSMNNGRTWSQPSRIWDSIGTSETAVDGVGGFWLVTEATGLYLAQVPEALTPQNWPADEISLSDQITSRAIVELVSVGSPRIPLVFFTTANEGWVHFGEEPGSESELSLFEFAPVEAALASHKNHVLVAGIQRGDGTSRVRGANVAYEDDILSATYIGRLNKSSEYPTAVSVTTVLNDKGKETGRFSVVWINDDGRVRIRTTRGGGKWTAPKTIAKFPSKGRKFPSTVTATSRWVVITAFDKNLRGLVLATRR